MGILKRHIEVPDLYNYKPEFYADGTEKHIFCEGARYHVLSYSSTADGACKTHCSVPKCEYNLSEDARISLIVDSVARRTGRGQDAEDRRRPSLTP